MKGVRLDYGATNVDVEAFAAEDPFVGDFLARYSGQARVLYGHVLTMFFRWLKVRRGLVFSGGELINEHLRRRALATVEDRRWALGLVLDFSRDNPDLKGRSGSRKYNLFSVVKTFFSYYEAELTSSRGVYGKKGMRKYRPKQMSLDVARRVLGVLPQRERSICLIMLQSGMSIGDVLNKFNFQLDYVQSCLRPGVSRIRVDFDERKGNRFTYFTYFSVDGIQELRKWLAIREAISRKLGGKVEKAVFIKAPNGRAYDVGTFEVNYSSCIRKAKLKDGPWSLNSHMFRKLFKTESRPPERNVDQDCVEFMMGHLSGIESVGGIYDRTPEIYEGVIEREYAKLEPYVNVYSGKPAVEARGLQLTDERLDMLEMLAKKFEEGKIKIEL